MHNNDKPMRNGKAAESTKKLTAAACEKAWLDHRPCLERSSPAPNTILAVPVMVEKKEDWKSIMC